MSDQIKEKTELNVASVEEIKKAEGQLVVDDIEVNELRSQAEDFTAMLLNANANNENPIAHIDAVGSEDVKQLQVLSAALKTPIRNMAAEDSDSNKISNSLIDLKVNVEAIDPGKIDFEPGWIGRILSMITGSSAVNRYMTKFSSTEDVINAIVRSLNEGKILLEQDNIIFADDKVRYRELTKVLGSKIALLREADRLIDERIQTEEDETVKRFLQEEVSFTLKQHIIDLEQTNAVTGQGVIALEMLIRNNRELIRGVQRASSVTVTALTIGATIMVGLSNQKKVLEKTKAVNDTTNNLILNTSKMLKNQGAEIQKQAASSTLDIDVLREAITNVISAVEDVETFKRDALPQMSNAIAELGSLSETVETKISKMEASEKIKISA